LKALFPQNLNDTSQRKSFQAVCKKPFASNQTKPNIIINYKFAFAWNAIGKLENTIAELRNAVSLDPDNERALSSLELVLKKYQESRLPGQHPPAETKRNSD